MLVFQRVLPLPASKCFQTKLKLHWIVKNSHYSFQIHLPFCQNVYSFSSENHTNLLLPLFLFKNFNPALYVNYENNKKAWMTSALFKKWLVNFNSEMRKNKRHILMILDNAPCHNAYIPNEQYPPWIFTSRLYWSVTTFGCGYNKHIQSSLSKASCPQYHWKNQ